MSPKKAAAAKPAAKVIKPYVGNIEKETLDNNFFRRVVFTSKNEQLVVMCLQGGEDIGNEIHDNVDQFFRIEKGSAKFVFEKLNEEKVVNDGGAAIVPMGTWHNVINMSKTDVLKLYTIYSPPNHPEGRIHKTKEEAEEAEKAEH